MTALNYSAGTVSLTNGSAVVTGIDTAWATALLKGGEIFVQAPGNPLPIATIDSDTQITAALSWTGETGIYDYVLRIGTAYDQQIAKNAEILARLLAEIESGTFWKYDASGDTAGRDVYDNRAKGFSYLDISGVQPILWVKASNDTGDWSGPFSYGVGPEGPQGPRGMNWRGAWSNAVSYLKDDAVSYNNASWIALVNNTNIAPVAGTTWGLLAARGATGATGTSFTYRGAYSAGAAYAIRDIVTDNGSSWIATTATTGNAPPVLPTTSNAFWALFAAKGLDGTGTGDVVGPPSAANGRVAVFQGTNGKVIGDGGVALSDLARLVDVQGSVDQSIDFYSSISMELSESREVAVAAGPDGNGLFDGLNSLTYVDTVGSVNIDTSVAGEIKPSVLSGGSKSSVSPPAGSSSFNGFIIGDRSWKIDNGKTVTKVGSYRTTAMTGTRIGVVKRNSAGNYDIVGTLEVFDHPGGGWADKTLATPIVIPATGDYYACYFSPSNASAWGVNAATDRFYMATTSVFSGTNLTFVEESGSATATRVSYRDTINNMSLRSANLPLDEIPTWARLLIFLDKVDAALNTNLAFDISRNGGTNFTTLSISARFNRGDGTLFVDSGRIDIASLPVGQVGKWRIRTSSGVRPRILAVGVMFGV